MFFIALKIIEKRNWGVFACEIIHAKNAMLCFASSRRQLRCLVSTLSASLRGFQRSPKDHLEAPRSHSRLIPRRIGAQTNAHLARGAQGLSAAVDFVRAVVFWFGRKGGEPATWQHGRVRGPTVPRSTRHHRGRFQGLPPLFSGAGLAFVITSLRR